MTKNQRRELNFRNAMAKDLYQLFELGIITYHSFQVAASSLVYVDHRLR